MHKYALLLNVGFLLPCRGQDLTNVPFRNGGELEQSAAGSGNVDGLPFSPCREFGEPCSKRF